MGQLTDYVKANFTPAEGIDISEVEKLETELDPLSGLSTVDQALDFMGRNDLFNRALKKHETTSIEKHDDKFMKDKYPEMLKSALDEKLKELNPDETPEQKRIRELEDKISAADKRDALNALKIELQSKAKEIGYTGNIDLFISQGDKAIETMEAYHEANTAWREKEKETMQKEVYKGNPPPKGGEDVPSDFNLDSEMNKLSFLNQ